jgi:hypothetical protein
MTELLLQVVFCELAIIGLWFAFSPGEIFGDVADYLEILLPKFLQKPIFSCYLCMSSVYGSLFFWLTHDLTNWHLILWPFYICALTGIGKVIGAALPKLTD